VINHFCIFKIDGDIVKGIDGDIVKGIESLPQNLVFNPYKFATHGRGP